jgi:AcrR family transcriptional regulator
MEPQAMPATIIDLSFYQSQPCREKILAAAFQFYAQRASGLVALSEVARAAQLPAAVVAWHFATEEKLRGQVLQRFFQWLLPSVLLLSQRRFRLARRTFSEEEMIQTFFRVLSRMLQRYRGLFSEDLRDLMAGGLQNRGTSLFYELLENFTPELAATIREGQAKGHFNPDLDQRTGTTLLKSLVNGGTVQCVMLDAAEDPSFYFERLCEQALDLLLAEPGDWRCWAE